jgi:hypothetical protein
LIEYAAALACFAAPFALHFDSRAATYWSIIAGVAILVVAATTDGPASIVSQIPIVVHVVLDYIVAGLLIASPFLFGFSKEGAPTAFFLALGILHLLVTIATKFVSNPNEVGSLAASTSVDIEAGEHTVLDD